MLNELNAHLLDAPSQIQSTCIICGNKATNKHHVIQKGIGGKGKKRKEGPLVSVCGFGNNDGCHGLIHANKLHLDYDVSKGWMYCEYQGSFGDALLEGKWHQCAAYIAG